MEASSPRPARHSNTMIHRLFLPFALAALVSSARPVGVGACNSPASVASVGVGSGGFFGVVVLEALGQPSIDGAGDFGFRISGGVPNGPGVLALSRNEQPTFSSTYQTTLYCGATPVFVPFQFDATGAATVRPGATTSPLAELCGRPLIAQAVAYDFTAPGGAGWTNGLRFAFGLVSPAK